MSKMIKNLEASLHGSKCFGAFSVNDMRDLAAFLGRLCRAISDHVGGEHKSCPVNMHDIRASYMTESQSVLDIIMELLDKIGECLLKMDAELSSKDGAKGSESQQHGCYKFILPILKELNTVCGYFLCAKEVLNNVMSSRRLSVNVLIRNLDRIDEHKWLLDLKDITDFETRRHLVMMMFPKTVVDSEELHDMLIDRSHLLEESFEYVVRANPKSFHAVILMQFKNEEATGPGVLREWFYLVFQRIFNPQNPLFLACPNDRRRFFPNPASKVDSMHLDYFRFCGRMIALALMKKVHVGIVLDRVFFLQLAGKLVSLEDVRDADPCLYMSYKNILEMDAELLDTDCLGLTFVREVEELGFKKVVELCPGGNDIIVNSKNRVKYVDLLIQHRFVTSVERQIAHFSKGFADILSNSLFQKLFFSSLQLEDLDLMLFGSETAISIEEWKAHTEYNGYKKTDCQICWFWEVVEGMSSEQQRILLSFWTSVRYLPIEGFRGLASRLHIYKASGSHKRLPSSQTCFYRLYIPPYKSEAAMRDQLHIITQEHVCCGFGDS